MSAQLLRNIGKLAFAGMTALLYLPAQAAPLLQGQTAFSSAVSAPSGSTLVGPLASPFSGGSADTAFSGTLTTTVYQENLANNPLGGVTFAFKFSDDSGSQTPIGRLTSGIFAGFLTDVGYVTPGVLPTSDDRNAGAVGWTFTNVGTNEQGLVNAGQSSALLVVRTNAPTYNSVIANIQGGAAATAGSYGPLPEPASVGLIAVGALLLRRRTVRV